MFSTKTLKLFSPQPFATPPAAAVAAANAQQLITAWRVGPRSWCWGWGWGRATNHGQLLNGLLSENYGTPKAHKAFTMLGNASQRRLVTFFIVKHSCCCCLSCCCCCLCHSRCCCCCPNPFGVSHKTNIAHIMAEPSQPETSPLLSACVHKF